uniref:FYVE-type domain-containing protein n=2 Tax=Amphora coffeiformis TaxID=265554 RepID=A0A6S8I7N2_9STRA
MADRPTIAMLPPEDTGHEEEQQQQAVENSNHSVATLSSPWQFDDVEPACASCKAEFNPFNRRHHCRLCGKIFCNDCSNQRSLIPPSSIVLAPRAGKKTTSQQAAENSVSFTPEEDPDRMLTYLKGSADANEILYGKGLEERFKLAREPLRVCRGCFQKLAPLQEDLRASNSNAMRFNHIDPTDPRRLFNSPLAHTLGHEVRKAAYTLNNLLPQPKRMGAVVVPPSPQSEYTATPEMQQCKESCTAISPNLSQVDGVLVPTRLLEKAKGIAFLTVVKGGFGLAGVEFGTGLVVARLDGNRWSAPSAIGTAGVSWGALIGAQVSDHVFFLMTDHAVQMMFSNEGSVQLGADVGVSVGPLGRSLEGNVGAAVGNVAPIYTYSLSKGFYAGVSLDGKVIVTRNKVNEKFYGRSVSGREILAGAVPLPPAAQPLYEALARCHVYATGSKPQRQHGGALGAIDEQHQEEYEYGEFLAPGAADYVPNEVQQSALAADHHSVAGMSDITADPGY